MHEQPLIEHSNRSLIKISAGDGELLLCAARAAFDPIRRALYVADVHLGKALSFRSLGVPVPGGTTALALTRLGDLIGELRAQTVFILGDLLHGPAVRDSGVIDQLMRWRHKYSDVRMVLIRGNHDHRAGDPPDRCGIEVIAEGLRDGPWILCHESRPEQAGYVLSGHVHPVYRLKGRADSIRLPAFLIGQRGAVLPAFGEFTGGSRIAQAPGDRVFVTDGQNVHAVPSVAN